MFGQPRPNVNSAYVKDAGPNGSYGPEIRPTWSHINIFVESDLLPWGGAVETSKPPNLDKSSVEDNIHMPAMFLFIMLSVRSLNAEIILMFNVR